MTKEYFVVANSFAAPFFSDTSTSYQKGETPRVALEAFVKKYSHPAGLYSAAVYESADAYHKDEKQLLRWVCNQELTKQEATNGKGCYSIRGRGPGLMEIDGKEIRVDKPKDGKILKGV